MVGLSERFSGTVLIVLITIVNATSMSWFGYDQGVFSGVLISKDFKKWFPETNEANISGITSSCFALGAFFGAIFAFTLGDKLGRRKTIAPYFACLNLHVGLCSKIAMRKPAR
ncbi:unnamed protein product [Parascedosporium putredinis]|uniref:Major facilitator superfamily (MFS) profile domain-containing protein n=1 Tax=Parascedosporium putredinis TaxID=1442378 RepID=A0A9P1GXG5_9PEZI|nr:unnamed protein product [Parascedosporium putredinis]CAI7989733.1 unnamed protein product [Parascedosporium putredinis]